MVVGVVVVVVVSTTAGAVGCGARLLLGLGANNSDMATMHIAAILVGVCTGSLLTAYARRGCVLGDPSLADLPIGSVHVSQSVGASSCSTLLFFSIG